MNIFKQLSIILMVYIAGEALTALLSLPVPGNVTGFFLLFLLLKTRLLKERQIEGVSDFFLKNLAFFFIPAGVGLMTVTSVLEGQIVKVLFIILVSLTLCIIVTAFTVKLFTGRKA